MNESCTHDECVRRNASSPCHGDECLRHVYMTHYSRRGVKRWMSHVHMTNAFIPMTWGWRVWHENGFFLHTNESCTNDSCVHTNESCQCDTWLGGYVIYKWVMADVKSRVTYERFMWTRMSQETYERTVSRMKESCHINMSHVKYE